MKILAISGSPRKKNVYGMIRTVCEAAGGDFEILNIADQGIHHCNDCLNCHKTYKCAINDDMQDINKKIADADCIVLGSPTYFDNVSGPMKNFMDRCLPFYFSRELEGKKAILLTSGNFEDQLEFDENGKCKWHKEEKQSVGKCLKSMESFCKIMGISIVGKIYALHDDWEIKESELICMGKRLL